MTPTAFLAGACVGFAFGVVGTLLAILIGNSVESHEVTCQQGEAGGAGGRGQGAGHGGTSDPSVIDDSDIQRRQQAAGETFRCAGHAAPPAGPAEGDSR